MDEAGNFAAAASTGGILLKLPGRIGDTPQIGCGLYADNRSGAATVTGLGEIAVRLVLSKTICSLMENGTPALRAAILVLSRLRRNDSKEMPVSLQLTQSGESQLSTILHSCHGRTPQPR